MSPNPIEIILPKQYYLPGEPVFGKVRVDFQEPFKTAGLSILFTGGVSTEIVRNSRSQSTEGVGTAWQKTTVTTTTTRYHSSRSFVTQRIELESAGELDGTKEYLFLFKLPENAPPSFKDKFGQLNYYVSVFAQKAKRIGRTRRAQAEILVPALTPSPMRVRARTEDGIAPRIELVLNCHTTTPNGELQGEFVVNPAGAFNKAKLGIELDWWARAQSEEESGRRNILLGEIPVNNVNAGAPVKFAVRLRNLEKAETFVDGEIYLRQSFLKVSLKRFMKSIDLLVPVEIGFPSITDAETAIGSFPSSSNSRRGIIFDPSLRLQDYLEVQPASDIPSDEASDILKEDEDSSSDGEN